MAVLGKDTKQPNEHLDWDIDLGDWMRHGDTIDLVTPSVRVLAGEDATPLQVTQTQNTATMSKVWLTGGTHGCRYRVQMRIETVMGRIKEAEFDISVKEI